MTVRVATTDEYPVVMGILDAAMLDTDDVESAIERGDVSVFVEDDRVLGVVVTSHRGDDVHVEAVAVRPGRRGQGIASTLVNACAPANAPLTASFDRAVEPFYRSLGFSVVARDGDRCRGRREPL